MKILWQDIFTNQIPFTKKSDLLWNLLSQQAEQLKTEGNEIDFSWLKRSADLNWYPYLEMINNLEIIDQVIKAERNGYDAVILGCYCDPGLREARGVVDIPVIGLSESSMSVAQMIGGRFAVVTVWHSYVPIMEKNLRLYGMEKRAIANRPIRHFDMDWSTFTDAIQGNSDALVNDFEKIALSCIEDGADVIIAGCGYLGPLLSQLNYREVKGTKVPVIDCVAAGIQTAESMAQLHRKTGLTCSRSKTSPYPRPSIEKLNSIRKRFGFE